MRLRELCGVLACADARIGLCSRHEWQTAGFFRDDVRLNGGKDFMTIYGITHTCQHVDEYDLRGAPEKREWEQKFLTAQACRECRQKFPPPPVSVAMLPPLIGSPQEIELANNLRVPKIQALREELEQQIEMSSVNSRAYSVARARSITPNIRKYAIIWLSLSAIILAKWWVETRTLNGMALGRQAISDGHVPEGTLDD